MTVIQQNLKVYQPPTEADTSKPLGQKLAKKLQELGLSWLKSAINSSIKQQNKPSSPLDRKSNLATPTANLSTSAPLSTLQEIKAMACQPIAIYHDHHLYFALKAIGLLPNRVIERINRQIGAPTKADYPNADAHLRLIFGINRKIRQPLDLAHLVAFRRRFDAYVVALQSPMVWRNAKLDRSATLSHPLCQAILGSKRFSQNVHWQDQLIANADDGEMLIRCYQSCSQDQKNSAKSLPILLYFHGGGFCIGNVDTHHELCYQLCAKSGWTVISADYRLAPEFPAPTALKDCLAAFAWVSRHAKDFGASAENIIVAGDSAGGCLSALVAQQLSKSQHFDYQDKSAQEQSLQDDDISTQIFRHVAGLTPPIAQLAFYPVTDSNIDYPSWSLYGKGLLLDHEDVMVFDSAYIQKSELMRSHALISPMAGDNSKLCPSFVVAAELDILRDEAIAYAKSLEADGVVTKTHLVNGAPHGFLHLAGVHHGLHQETNLIINDFIAFVQPLIHDQSS